VGDCPYLSLRAPALETGVQVVADWVAALVFLPQNRFADAAAAVVGLQYRSDEADEIGVVDQQIAAGRWGHIAFAVVGGGHAWD